ncbi:hypothetical protein [Synechococcus sp. BS55D]|uniref:hypothetical protein n=1 Tax=Synechococcus sp. BS55D TaxID=2055943 RepID=UPI00103A97E1|nr:hypothetical protein [Synechococcus sp. BS55D]TCD58065.1 hypothetical protein CWE16_01825 [Synechococcus sp. BS55D]
MDADFQQRYLSAEQAYGEGNYPQARDLSMTLLEELNGAEAKGRSEEALIAWRAVLSLLLGHIEFHGFQDRAAAEAHYQRVLSCQPPETLRELAEQGIGRCLPSATATVTKEQSQALIQDPFLSADAATPWLDSPSTGQSRSTRCEPLEPTPEQEVVIQQDAQPEPSNVDLSPFLLRYRL